MVVIRMARAGSKHRPFYHLTVADRQYPRDGRYIERVGFYNPLATGKEVRLRVNLPRVDHWLSVGAQPSSRAATLVRQAREQVLAGPLEERSEKNHGQAAATSSENAIEETPASATNAVLQSAADEAGG